jgi:hypothetical protein
MPGVVAYYMFSDVQQAADHLPLPWIKIHSTGEEVVVAVVDDSSLKLKVTIKADFVATVQVYGLLAPDETDNIEKQSLKSFLAKLNGKFICTGISNDSLQDFAELPGKHNNGIYFRHIICKSVDSQTSTVRSKTCNL